MNIQTGDVQMHNAVFNAVQHATWLIVVNKVLHDSRGNGSQSVSLDVGLQTLQEGALRNDIRSKALVDPTKQHIPDGKRTW